MKVSRSRKDDNISEDSVCPACKFNLHSHSVSQLIQCAINELSKKELLGQQHTERPSITSRSKEVTIE